MNTKDKTSIFLMFSSIFLLVAMSIPSSNFPIIIISLAIIGFIIFYWRKNLSGLRQNKCLNLGLVFILAGAVGNLIDRVRFGYVIDFLDFRIWPVFNLADSAITIGAGLVIWQLVIKKKSKGL